LTLFSLLSMLRKFSCFPFLCVCYHILLPTFPLYNSAYIISLQASKIKHISFLVVFLLNKCMHSCPIFAYFCRSEHLANVLALKDLLRQQVLFQCNSSILCFANLLFLFTDVLLFPWIFFQICCTNFTAYLIIYFCWLLHSQLMWFFYAQLQNIIRYIYTAIVA